MFCFITLFVFQSNFVFVLFFFKQMTAYAMRIRDWSSDVCASDLGVTPYYEPMVAKLIAWGEDRDTARGRAVTALRALRVEGIRTNRDFLIACVEDETFAAGDVHTGFIDARRSVLLAA